MNGLSQTHSWFRTPWHFCVGPTLPLRSWLVSFVVASAVLPLLHPDFTRMTDLVLDPSFFLLTIRQMPTHIRNLVYGLLAVSLTLFASCTQQPLSSVNRSQYKTAAV